MINQREYERIDVDIPAVAYFNNKEVKCRIKNISITGIGLDFLIQNFPENINRFSIQFIDDNLSKKNSCYTANLNIAVRHKEINEEDNSHIFVGGMITNNKCYGFYEYVCLKNALNQKKVGFRNFKNGIMTF